MQQTVLVAGATGTLGSRIAYHLLDQPATAVRLLVRSGTRAEPAEAALLAPLVRRGAEVVDGDLTDHPSLDRATKGADVIVCAAQGGPDVTVGGQVELATAGRKNGVRRVLPSDFTMDLFKAPEGGSMLLDMRRTADSAIRATGIEQVNVLCGLFMETFFNPHFDPALFDLQAATARIWGSGHERFEVTSIEDTARYAARAATDRALPGGKFAVAGQTTSLEEITQALEQATGRTFKREPRGTIADLQAWIADKRANDPNPFAPIAATHELYMLTGITALTDLQNARYPEIRPETFSQFLQRTFATRNLITHLPQPFPGRYNARRHWI